MVAAAVAVVEAAAEEAVALRPWTLPKPSSLHTCRCCLFDYHSFAHASSRLVAWEMTEELAAAVAVAAAEEGVEAAEVAPESCPRDNYSAV